MSSVVPPPTRLGREHDLDSMREVINDLSTHLRGVSEELAAERTERQKEREKGISVTRLHIPMVILFVVLAPLVSAGIAAGMFWRDAHEHMADVDIHASKVLALSRGGVAYTKDIDDKLASKVSDLEAADRRVARAVKQGAQCTSDPKKKGAISCAFTDPMSISLRP